MATDTTGERLTAWSVKVRPSEVEALQQLARLESLRLNRDVTWADLVRQAMTWMATNKRPVGM